MREIQVIEQLKLIKRLYRVDDAQKLAIDIAVKIIQESINKGEPCIFDNRDKCTALNTKDCSTCNFRCTKKDWDEGQAKVAKRLKKLGVKAVVKSYGPDRHVELIPVDN